MTGSLSDYIFCRRVCTRFDRTVPFLFVFLSFAVSVNLKGDLGRFLMPTAVHRHLVRSSFLRYNRLDVWKAALLVVDRADRPLVVLSLLTKQQRVQGRYEIRGRTLLDTRVQQIGSANGTEGIRPVKLFTSTVCIDFRFYASMRAYITVHMTAKIYIELYL